MLGYRLLEPQNIGVEINLSIPTKHSTMALVNSAQTHKLFLND
ncbi:hypothetical protein ROE7235_03801 [Roseibaca ekhonensis]|jgi:hypothetical protein|uniref:Uncharacterized protein n=1 Tax=Roseinatronobacter ekhonensis TaxID=254356 RepID=A0A3B0MF02_9RHOB|nr:hypothetical protein ROE7235_03801 [Roseibaca ekhonensis]